MTELRAFHGDSAIKAKYLQRVRWHREHDNLIKGTGWHNGKGCAIGCTLESYDHNRYPIELGIPESLARLEDAIFEGLPNGDAQGWPERFLEAITVGADLSRVADKWLLWLLTESGIEAFEHELVRHVVQQCADIVRRRVTGERVSVGLTARTRAAAEAARTREAAVWATAAAVWAAEAAVWAAAVAAATHSSPVKFWHDAADALARILEDTSCEL